MDDTQLLRALAQIMGWEVVGPRIEHRNRPDFGGAAVYIDEGGCLWRLGKQQPTIIQPDADRVILVPWRPLIDMNDAMGIAERLRADGWHYEIGDHISDPGIHGASFGRGYWDHYNHSWSESVEAAADTPARAICLAALETREEGR